MPAQWAVLLLCGTLGAQLVLFAFTAVSAFAPRYRMWPPPAPRSWQLYTTWILSWVSLSGACALSVPTTLGARGRLVRSGPYRFSRNPQYVGTCAYLASLVLLSGSHLAAVACLAIAPWFLVTPFVEEPWLLERFGEPYARYCAGVPRFLGRARGGARGGSRLPTSEC